MVRNAVIIKHCVIYSIFYKMITLFVGKVGSGKSLNAVRYMLETKHIDTYTNIVMKKKQNHIHTLKIDHIVTDRIKKYKKNAKGEEIPVMEKAFNSEFWNSLADKPLNIVIDEMHTVMSSRNSMSIQNRIMGDFFALIRKLLAGRRAMHGQCILITQLFRRADIIVRQMAQQVVHHHCFWIKECKKCKFKFWQHSEQEEECLNCPKCNYYYFNEFGHYIIVSHYNTDSIDLDNFALARPFKQYRLNNINKYFGIYDTFQVGNFFSNY